HTRLQGDWSSDVCSSDLNPLLHPTKLPLPRHPLCRRLGLAMGCHRRVLQRTGTEPMQYRAMASAELQSDLLGYADSNTYATAVYLLPGELLCVQPECVLYIFPE